MKEKDRRRKIKKRVNEKERERVRDSLEEEKQQ
jgi:hypothetical protein